MKEFTALKTLSLNGACFCPEDEHDDEHDQRAEDEGARNIDMLVNLLPSSLESVTVIGHNPGLYNPMMELVQHVRRGSFPHLKKFVETGFHARSPPHPFKPVEDAMMEAGISYLSSP